MPVSAISHLRPTDEEKNPPSHWRQPWRSWTGARFVVVTKPSLVERAPIITGVRCQVSGTRKRVPWEFPKTSHSPTPGSLVSGE